MIINNNFSMRAICIGGVVGLLVAVGANYLMPKINTQNQTAYPNSKIEKTTPAFVASNGNPLLHLKTTILKAVSDAQEFTHMIGGNEQADQMIIMDALAKSIKKESNHSEPHSGLQFGIQLKDYAEEKLIREIKNYARLKKIMQEVEQMRKEISWRR